MNSLPPELACHIGQFCDFSTLIRLQSVDYRWNCISRYIFSNWLTLNLQKDLDSLFQSENSKKVDDVINFLYDNVQNVRELVVNSSRMRLSCSDFILIARSMPNLEVLEIEQSEKETVGYDSLYSLRFFQNLKFLSLKGWNRFNLSGRGSSYRTTLPYGHFLHLESLRLHNTATVLDFLMNIRSYASKMSRLRSLELVFSDHSEKSSPLLQQFLLDHEHLTTVILEKLRNFVQMTDLKELQLSSFEFPASLDPEVISCFVAVMKKNDVFLLVE